MPLTITLLISQSATKIDALRAEVADTGKALVEARARVRELETADTKLREKVESLSTAAAKEAGAMMKVRRESKAMALELAELRPLTGALADVEAKLHVAEQLAEAGKTHAQQLSETETQSANLRKVLPAYPQSADN